MNKNIWLALSLQILPLLVIGIILLCGLDWSFFKVELFLVIVAVGLYEVLIGSLMWKGWKQEEEECYY